MQSGPGAGAGPAVVGRTTHDARRFSCSVFARRYRDGRSLYFFVASSWCGRNSLWNELRILICMREQSGVRVILVRQGVVQVFNQTKIRNDRDQTKASPSVHHYSTA